MISQLFIWIVKYAFGFPVVAMVSHIPVKSRMAVNYVMGKELPKASRFWCHAMTVVFTNVRKLLVQ